MSSSVSVPSCPISDTHVPSTQKHMHTSLTHYHGHLLCSNFILKETSKCSLFSQPPRARPQGQQTPWELGHVRSLGGGPSWFHTHVQSSHHPNPSNVPPLPLSLPCWWQRQTGLGLRLVGGPGQDTHSIIKLLILVSSTAVSKPGEGRGQEGGEHGKG